jgi:glycosyltransferase involved in cell wall biosynthesis
MRTWQVLQYLHEQGHQVVLVSFVSPEEEGYIQFLWQICSGVYTVPLVRTVLSQSTAYLRSMISGQPLLVEQENIKEMRSTVSSILDSGQIDIVHVQQLSMAQFAFLQKDFAWRRKLDPNRDSGRNFSTSNQPTIILDVNQAEWTVAERMQQNAPELLRPFFAIEAKRIKQYEGMMMRNVNHVISSTDKTTEKLLEANAFVFDRGEADRKNGLINQDISIITIPNGLDVSEFPPVSRLPGSKKILSMGSFNNPAYADGIHWFIQNALPKILQQVPEAQFAVIGNDPPHNLRNLAEQYSGVIAFATYGPDLSEHLKSSALTIFPFRSGRGFRRYILEAFAYGMPVVSTGVGLEGVEVDPGQEVLLADTPSKFTDEVIRLLLDESLQCRLAKAARELIETRYKWGAVMAALNGIYHSERERFNA